MKHCFIINPVAGKKNCTDDVKKELIKYSNLDIDVHITTCLLDAKEYARNICKANPFEELRFYSCGGDGTANEVANGIYGFDNASLGVLPYGSGNDFVKALHKKEITVDKMINGNVEYMDLISVNGKICINICNVGFDAAVCINMEKFKKWKFVSGGMAYKLACFYSLLKEMKHYGKVYKNGELLYDGPFLLTAACNGVCCGGSFYFAPDAIINDGKLDNLLVTKVSRFKFISLISKFKSGEYLKYPKVMKYMKYSNDCKRLEIFSEKEIAYGLDGECYKDKHVLVEVLPHAIKMINPID